MKSNIFSFLVNTTLGSSLNSPLESPDILQRYVTRDETESATTLIVKSQQVRLHTFQTNHNSCYAKTASETTSCFETQTSAQNSTTILESMAKIKYGQKNDYASGSVSEHGYSFGIPKLNTIHEHSTSTGRVPIPQTPILTNHSPKNTRTISKDRTTTLLEFSLSSVGRSFIDETGENSMTKVQACDSLKTPDTPEPNISPSSSSVATKSCFSETFSNDFIKPSTPSVTVSPLEEQVPKYASSTTTNNTNGGSWDLLELDLDFHHVNFDPSFGGDVQENLFFRDDPLCTLQKKTTKLDSHDL